MKTKLSLFGAVAALAAIAPTSVLAQTSIDELMADSQEDGLAQVTSVSQLSDVQPTDWAFQALQSLVERYGCIAGYPDGTFRGNRSATRYEMAAALNACLDNISDKFATKEDLEAVKALQEEFQAELATLRGRVDGLEARTDTLEAQQFSTTTKLEGGVIITPQFGDQINDGGANPNSRPSVVAEVGLTFNTSFTGRDLLSTTLLTGNGGNDFFGTFFDGAAPLATNGTVNPGAIEYRDTGNAVELDSLFYQFPIGDDVSVTVGAQLYPSDFIDANSYANDPGADFNSGFFINNPLVINDAIDDPGGAGVGFDWNINGGPVSLRAGYVAANATEAVDDPATPGNDGLFGDPNTVVTELEYADDFGDSGNSFAARLQYSYSQAGQLEQHALGFNGEVTFGKFGLFGRYGIGLSPDLAGVNLFGAGSVLGGNSSNVQTWMAGVGVADLLVPGSMLSVAVGQPYITSVAGPEQTNFEGFYRVPINDNITISPGVMVISDPLNVNQNTLIQGVLRTTFSF